jgi:hypothetical protein
LKEEDNAQVYDKYDNFIRMIINKLIELNLMIQAHRFQQHNDQVKELFIKNQWTYDEMNQQWGKDKDGMH